MPTEMLVGPEFAQYLADTEPQAKLIDASAFRHSFKAFRRGEGKGRESVLPWGKTHALFQFRTGEVTEWMGPRGHGKSMALSHVVLGLLKQGEKAAIMSFEMSPHRQLERFGRQYGACSDPTDDVYESMLDWMHGKLWFYDQTGRVNPRTVYAVCRFAAARKGVTHVVIDNLMKVVKGADDYNAQKDFVNDLTTIARDTGLHIHLVHHTKKLGDETQVPTADDSKGAGEIPDQVDNILIVWRNKPKELLRARQDQGRPLSDKELEKLDAPDAILACDKQRNGEWEGRIALWFHKGSFQYCADASCKPTNYVDLLTQGRAA